MNEEKTSCEEEITLPALSSAFGPASPIISIKNHIYFYDDVNTTVARSLIAALHEIAMSIITTATENNTPIVPIYLHINSYGGDVSDALAIVQAIKDIQNGSIHKIGDINIKIPVNTIIEGEADSAASLIACVGSRRYISKYALSLIHDIRQIGGAGGKVEDVELSAKNLKMFKQKFYDIYLKHSNLNEEQLTEICGKEDYSTPEQLLEWGLVDEIIE
jgi:ATP-dependent protease ClpP protease subunit